MNQLMDSPGAQSRIVIVGTGCARYHCAGYTGTEVAAQGQLGHPDVFAAGDAAAVPDLTRPGQLAAMTAQHAQRQGKAAGRNVAATLGHRSRQPYKHRDLGFVVDLGGWQAVANPPHIPLSDAPAKIVTRACHLYALPANRLRVATDWFDDIIEHRQFVQLGLIPNEYSGIAAAEHTDIYYQPDGQPLNRHAGSNCAPSGSGECR